MLLDSCESGGIGIDSEKTKYLSKFDVQVTVHRGKFLY